MEEIHRWESGQGFGSPLRRWNCVQTDAGCDVLVTARDTFFLARSGDRVVHGRTTVVMIAGGGPHSVGAVENTRRHLRPSRTPTLWIGEWATASVVSQLVVQTGGSVGWQRSLTQAQGCCGASRRGGDLG